MFARAALLRVTMGAAAGVDLIAAMVFFTGFAATLLRLAVFVAFLERFAFVGIVVPSVELANHTLLGREVKPNFWAVRATLRKRASLFPDYRGSAISNLENRRLATMLLDAVG